ncbi:MAG TPA: hypothetical protein VIH59_36995 [Candidatus Tectomicrobia bacterium]|jgi:hypothetical protein
MSPIHETIGLFRAVNWAAHCAGVGRPAARLPCQLPGLQRGVDTSVRTRVFTGGAVFASIVPLLGVRR